LKAYKEAEAPLLEAYNDAYRESQARTFTKIYIEENLDKVVELA